MALPFGSEDGLLSECHLSSKTTFVLEVEKIPSKEAIDNGTPEIKDVRVVVSDNKSDLESDTASTAPKSSSIWTIVGSVSGN